MSNGPCNRPRRDHQRYNKPLLKAKQTKANCNTVWLLLESCLSQLQKETNRNQMSSHWGRRQIAVTFCMKCEIWFSFSCSNSFTKTLFRYSKIFLSWPRQSSKIYQLPTGHYWCTTVNPSHHTVTLYKEQLRTQSNPRCDTIDRLPKYGHNMGCEFFSRRFAIPAAVTGAPAWYFVRTFVSHPPALKHV